MVRRLVDMLFGRRHDPQEQLERRRRLANLEVSATEVHHKTKVALKQRDSLVTATQGVARELAARRRRQVEGHWQ